MANIRVKCLLFSWFASIFFFVGENVGMSSWRRGIEEDGVNPMDLSSNECKVNNSSQNVELFVNMG